MIVVNKRIRGTEVRMVVRDGRGVTVFTTDADLDYRRVFSPCVTSVKRID